MGTIKPVIKTRGIVWMLTMGRVGGFGRIEPVEVYEPYLDWLASNEINAYAYPVSRLTSWPVDRFSALCKSAAKRGIQMFAMIRDAGMWEDGQRTCATNKEHLSELKGQCRRIMDAGAAGINYAADDYTPIDIKGRRSLCHCKQCDKMFNGSLGTEQVSILETVHEAVGDAPCYFVPTLYQHYNVAIDGAAPNPDNPFIVPREQWLAYWRDLQPVRQSWPALHVMLTNFESEPLEDYKQAGAWNYSYWHNGPRSIQYWSRWCPHHKMEPHVPPWEGFQWLENAWTGVNWCDGHLNADSPSLDELWTIGDRADDAWMCVHNFTNTLDTVEYPAGIWGQFCLDPQLYKKNGSSAESVGILG